MDLHYRSIGRLNSRIVFFVVACSNSVGDMFFKSATILITTGRFKEVYSTPDYPSNTGGHSRFAKRSDTASDFGAFPCGRGCSYNAWTDVPVRPLEPRAINWLATKYTGDEQIKATAEFICTYAQQATDLAAIYRWDVPYIPR